VVRESLGPMQHPGRVTRRRISLTWSTRHVRVDSDGHAKPLGILAVTITEVVLPLLLNHTGVDETVRVGAFLDEHHWRQVVQLVQGQHGGGEPRNERATE
jgi:hypothetical protein